ncbi:MAG: hypothetical protein WCT52_04420 [Candidatus Micrarchaeia archaeon]
MKARTFNAFLFLMASAHATGVDSVAESVFQLCASSKALLPPVSMLMILVAAIIYSAGQVMGAETRARANVWATAALTGALIGILIYALAPGILGVIYGNSIGCDTFIP